MPQISPHCSPPTPLDSYPQPWSQLLTSYQNSTRFRLMGTCILKLWPWANYLTSLRLSFLLCEMVIIMPPAKQFCEFNENIILKKFLPVDGASSFTPDQHALVSVSLWLCPSLQILVLWIAFHLHPLISPRKGTDFQFYQLFLAIRMRLINSKDFPWACGHWFLCLEASNFD